MLYKNARKKATKCGKKIIKWEIYQRKRTLMRAKGAEMAFVLDTCAIISVLSLTIENYNNKLYN